MKNIWTLSIVLALGLTPLSRAFGQEKVQPLSVAVNASTAEIVKVNGPTMSLSGKASGGAGVTRVTWQTSNGVTGTATGTTAWDARGIPVAEGNTTIVLRAYDAKGASSWVAVVAVRPATERPVAITSAAKPQQTPVL